MSKQASERPYTGQAGFELPVSAASEPRRIRRSLFGYRGDDVQAELDIRNEEIDELRRDVSALWLAFGQHERAIRDLLTTLGRISGATIEPPGGRAQPPSEPRLSDEAPPAEPPAVQPAEPEPAPEAVLAATPIGRQLSGLDEVLAAIEDATHSLERTYSDQIAASEPGDDPQAGERNGIIGGEEAASRA